MRLDCPSRLHWISGPYRWGRTPRLAWDFGNSRLVGGLHRRWVRSRGSACKRSPRRVAAVCRTSDCHFNCGLVDLGHRLARPRRTYRRENHIYFGASDSRHRERSVHCNLAEPLTAGRMEALDRTPTLRATPHKKRPGASAKQSVTPALTRGLPAFQLPAVQSQGPRQGRARLDSRNSQGHISTLVPSA
jgi:hypothetical protein